CHGTRYVLFYHVQSRVAKAPRTSSRDSRGGVARLPSAMAVPMSVVRGSVLMNAILHLPTERGKRLQFRLLVLPARPAALLLKLHGLLDLFLHVVCQKGSAGDGDNTG